MSTNDTTDTEQSDSCMRAAEAAIQVVREECGGMDVEIREMDNGMFLELPTVDLETIEDVEDGAITFVEFANVIDESSFLRSWLGGVVAAEDVVEDSTNADYAARVHTFAESVFDEPLAFSADDLVGSDVLADIEDAG